MVLDNLECLLEPGDVKGHFRPGFEGYEQLLHRVARTGHQSCLLLTSREKPASLRPLANRYSTVRSLRLTGLDVAACKQLLEERKVVGTEPEKEQLIEIYAGNPLALKMVAETIVDLFGGEVGPFLAEGTVIFSGINDLLGEQFVRLSALEQSVLCWLAIMREPVTLDELQALLVIPQPRVQILEAVDAGYRRCLIERGERPGSFTLQPVVLEYVTQVLITEACREIQQRRLGKLIQYGLSHAHAKEYVRQMQERFLVSPLLAELRSIYPKRADVTEQGQGTGSAVACELAPLAFGTNPTVSVEEQLLGLLDELRELAHNAQGYGPANLIALLRELRGHLAGLDLSRLCLRGAYLQGIEMQDASLAGALIRDCVFTEAINATWTVAISLDGKLRAAGGIQGKVRIWNEGDQTRHLIWQAHASSVQTLAFCPDGQTLATAGGDGTIKLWNLHNAALLWAGWQEGVQSLAFSPDGSLLASAGLDATVRLWVTGSHGDKPLGINLQTLTHPSGVFAVAFSPDGDLLASGCFYGEIRLWVKQETEPATYVKIRSIQTNWVTSLAFAPDGRTLASAHMERVVRLWEVGSLRLLQTLSELQARRLAWSPDGRVLASYCDKTILLWDVEEGRIRSALHGHTGEVHRLAFAPDSSRLLSGSAADGTLRVWNVESRQCVRVIAGYGVALIDLDWSPDGTHLVSGGTDTLVTIWNVSGGTPLRILCSHSWFVTKVAWSPDGKFVASCGWDMTMRLWDPISGACIQSFEDFSTLLLSVAWSPDGSLLACGTHLQGMQVWDVGAHSLRWVGQLYQTMFIDIAWSPDGTWLATCCDDGSVYLWESADGTLLKRLPGHRGWVHSVVWSPDGTRLASSSGGKVSGELFMWDVRSGVRLQAFAEHSGQVHGVVWSPSGDQLISGDSDGMLRWWDVESGECVCMRTAHQGAIRSLKLSRDGRRLASCGDDEGAIRIWDLTSHEHLQTLRHDRPYERLNITGIRGLNEAQKESLRALGAIEEAAPQIEEHCLA
jgi:WD40 repeat protein